MSKTSIEWTEHNWNPVVGCSIVSPGCTNCYAMGMAARIERMNPDLERYRGLTKATKAGAVWTGKMALAPEATLLEPLKRKKPTVYFVNSMSDLFHESVPDEWIDKIFAVMSMAKQHTFQVLTKRSGRMRQYVTAMLNGERQIGNAARSLNHRGEVDHVIGAIYPISPDMWKNVWLGVSAERQKEADERIPDLLETPAAVRFVSAEPLLGPIDFTRTDVVEGFGHTNALRGYERGGSGYLKPAHLKLDWIIVGGESGPNARPMHPDWVRSIRDQCAAAGTAFFFKQWGEWEIASDANGRRNNYSGHIMPETDHKFTWVGLDGRTANPSARDVGDPAYAMARVGKARAGRLLDGVIHDAMPSATPSKSTQPETVL